MQIEITYDFEEIELIPHLWLHATGTAHIYCDGDPDQWVVTAIQIKQGVPIDRLPMPYLSQFNGNECVFYWLIETALRRDCSDSIEEAVMDAMPTRQEIAGERYEYAKAE